MYAESRSDSCDVTVAYHTVWLWGLHRKLLCMIPDHHMVSFLMELLTKCNFKLKISYRQVSCLRQIRNGVPQGSMLAPILFNVYISDIPSTTSRFYGYADDLILFTAQLSWNTIEEILTHDLDKLSVYLMKWWLKLSTVKTTTTTFHVTTEIPIDILQSRWMVPACQIMTTQSISVWPLTAP